MKCLKQMHTLEELSNKIRPEISTVFARSPGSK